MAWKASQAKPPAWPAPPSFTTRQLSSGGPRESARSVSTPTMPSIPTTTYKSTEPSSVEKRVRSSSVNAKESTDTAVSLAVNASNNNDVETSVHHDSFTAESAQTAEAQNQAVLPMTPTSPDARSPSADAATLTTETAPPARSAAVSHDIEVVDELLTTMKQMLGTLGSTFDTLGDQTIKVATLPAAIDAVHQIASARQQLDEQHMRQEERMMEVKNLLLNEVRTRLHARLKDTASAIVKEIIQREIAERVRTQLQEQIPQAMRDEVIRYKHQIMEVRVSLHNSEARRHNALIRSNSLDEPLRPLLRSPPSLGDVFPPLAVSDGDGSETPRAPAPTGTGVFEPGRPALTIDASFNAGGKSGHGGHGKAKRSAVTPLSALDLQEPAPSPRFPQDLNSLTMLSPIETKELMRDYGLVKLKRVVHRGNGSPGGETTPTANNSELEIVEVIEANEPREETLNRFLSYIGVGFRLVPAVPTSPPRAKGVAIGTPMVSIPA